MMIPGERAKFEAEIDDYIVGLRVILRALVDGKKTMDEAIEDMAGLRMSMQAKALLDGGGDPCNLKQTPRGAAVRG